MARKAAALTASFTQTVPGRRGKKHLARVRVFIAAVWIRNGDRVDPAHQFTIKAFLQLSRIIGSRQRRATQPAV